MNIKSEHCTHKFEIKILGCPFKQPSPKINTSNIQEEKTLDTIQEEATLEAIQEEAILEEIQEEAILEGILEEATQEVEIAEEIKIRNRK